MSEVENVQSNVTSTVPEFGTEMSWYPAPNAAMLYDRLKMLVVTGAGVGVG